MALIGYARVATAEQDTALQTDALLKAGCERVFDDTVSGVKINRPAWPRHCRMTAQPSSCRARRQAAAHAQWHGQGLQQRHARRGQVGGGRWRLTRHWYFVPPNRIHKIAPSSAMRCCQSSP